MPFPSVLCYEFLFFAHISVLEKPVDLKVCVCYVMYVCAVCVNVYAYMYMHIHMCVWCVCMYACVVCDVCVFVVHVWYV